MSVIQSVFGQERGCRRAEMQIHIREYVNLCGDFVR